MDPETKEQQIQINLVESTDCCVSPCEESPEAFSLVEHSAATVSPQVAAVSSLSGAGRSDTQPSGLPVHDSVHGIRTSDCVMDWSLMKGDDRWRQCTECGFDVLKLVNPSAELLNESLSERGASTGKRKSRVWRRPDGTFIMNDCKSERQFKTKRGALILFFVGYAPLIFAYTMAPGYILPYLNHPVGRLFMVASIIWHMLGCLGFSMTNGKRFSHGLLRYAIIIVFTMPIMLCAMLGPAVVAILDAFTYRG